MLHENTWTGFLGGISIEERAEDSLPNPPLAACSLQGSSGRARRYSQPSQTIYITRRTI
jgi:hypothetical protein